MTLSNPYEAMARRIAAIDEAEFAGAVVIVPPNGAEPIEFLYTDPKPDVAQFWAGLQGRVQARAAEAMSEEETRRKSGQAYGWR